MEKSYGLFDLGSFCKDEWIKLKGLFAQSQDTLSASIYDILVIGALAGILLTIIGSKKWGVRITVVSMILAVVGGSL